LSRPFSKLSRRSSCHLIDGDALAPDRRRRPRRAAACTRSSPGGRGARTGDDDELIEQLLRRA
jgi:hypothetical protein